MYIALVSSDMLNGACLEYEVNMSTVTISHLIFIINKMMPSIHSYGTKRIQPARGWCATVEGTVQIVSTYLASTESTKHITLPLSAPYVKHPHTTYSTAHTYVPQTTYWTFGCLPREWYLCWSGGRDAWQGCSDVIGLLDPSTATRRRGRSTTTYILMSYYIMQTHI